LPVTKHINYKKKRTSKIGFDQIYIINLERREDRRKRMEQTLDELNLSYNMTKAIDGKKIDENYLKDLNIKIIPGYKDPYSDRSLNYGEIGCFLSHYFIWKDVKYIF
jgi:collagen beta-1,O-galactosyltransferase